MILQHLVSYKCWKNCCETNTLRHPDEVVLDKREQTVAVRDRCFVDDRVLVDLAWRPITQLLVAAPSKQTHTYQHPLMYALRVQLCKM